MEEPQIVEITGPIKRPLTDEQALSVAIYVINNQLVTATVMANTYKKSRAILKRMLARMKINNNTQGLEQKT